jgi:cytochrome c oxidase subunit 2
MRSRVRSGPRTDASRRLEEHVTGAGANRHRIRDRRSRLLISLLPAAVLLLLSGCTLQPASEQAHGVKTLYEITFVFAAVIFVIVGGLIVGFAIRYRRKPGDDDLPPQIHGNSTIEVVWTAIPTLIVLILFVLSAIELGRLDTAPASPKPMIIDVTGFQWQWHFAYPEFKTSHGNAMFVEGTSGETTNLPTLHLPVNQPIHFHLESQDVIHDFFVPVFLFKRDVVPGHPNDFTMTPDRLGSFAGKCAELCGLYHSRMLFNVLIQTPAQFQAWAQVATAAQDKKENLCRTAQSGVVTIAAQNIKFDTACMQTAADQPFKIDFDNKDAGTPHNVAIYKDSSLVQNLFRGAIVTGPTQVTYSVNPLSAGTYYFHCDVHPGMNGSFRVQ